MKRFLAAGFAMATSVFSAGAFAEAQQGSQPSQGAQISQPGAPANQPSSSLKVEFPQGLPPASAGTSANRPRGELKMDGWSDYGVKKIDAMTLKQTNTKNSKKKKQIRDVQRQFD